METLKVEMNVSIAADNFSYSTGSIVELDKELADAWLESGHAKPIKGEKVDKTALPEGVEYHGHGVYVVLGNQPAATKKDAIEALKVRQAAAKAAAEAKAAEEAAAAEAEAAAKAEEEAAAAAAAEEATNDAENNDASDGGADNADGSESASKG